MCNACELACGQMGRSNIKHGSSGGLRLGEMERDVLVAHGVTSFMKESFMDRSDRHRMVVERRTHVPAQIANTGAGVYRDYEVMAANPSKFSTVEVPYAFKLMQQELQSMCIDMRMQDIDDVSDVDGGRADYVDDGEDDDGDYGDYDDYVDDVVDAADDFQA